MLLKHCVAAFEASYLSLSLKNVNSTRAAIHTSWSCVLREESPLRSLAAGCVLITLLWGGKGRLSQWPASKTCQDREKKARFLVTAFKIKLCRYDHNKKKKRVMNEGPGIDRRFCLIVFYIEEYELVFVLLISLFRRDSPFYWTLSLWVLTGNMPALALLLNFICSRKHSISFLLGSRRTCSSKNYIELWKCEYIQYTKPLWDTHFRVTFMCWCVVSESVLAEDENKYRS